MADNNPCCEGSLRGDGQVVPHPGVWAHSYVGHPAKTEHGRAAPEHPVSVILNRGLLSCFGQYRTVYEISLPPPR